MKKAKTIILSITIFVVQNIDAQDTIAVKTIEGTVNKMIELLSVEKGEANDWESYKYLFLPGAHKIILNPDAKNPIGKALVFNLEEFIRFYGHQYPKDGFIETTIGLKIDEYNGIANVFQAYHAKTLDGKYDKKGINSYQLVFFDGRWWIASTTWTNETEDNKIPKKYLKY